VDTGLDVHEDVRAPQPLDDIGARDELPTTLDQEDQQIHRLPLESNRAPVVAQFVRGEIEHEIAEAKRLAGIGRHDFSPFQPTYVAITLARPATSPVRQDSDVLQSLSMESACPPR
jgi:hypothetical protein